MKQRVLITGAAGFMGGHLTDALIDLGHDVYALDDLSGGYTENVNKKTHFAQIDLRDKEKTTNYINEVKPELIFHLAADATEGRSQFTPLECTMRNYISYLHLLIPAIKNGVKKIVLTSSMSVYGSQQSPFDETMDRKPDDIYGISKAAMERATEVMSDVYGFHYVIIRPHNVYGPKQNMVDPYRNVIAIFINCILHDRNFFIYGDGEQKRAFSYINDFTPYIVKAGFSDEVNGEIFNIGPIQEYSINQLAKIVLDTFFPDGNVPQHLVPKYLPQRPKEVKEAWCTVAKAEKMLGYKTSVSLEEGIRNMVEWAKKIGPKEFRYLDNLEIVNDKTPISWVKKLI